MLPSFGNDGPHGKSVLRFLRHHHAVFRSGGAGLRFPAAETARSCCPASSPASGVVSILNVGPSDMRAVGAQLLFTEEARKTEGKHLHIHWASVSLMQLFTSTPG